MAKNLSDQQIEEIIAHNIPENNNIIEGEFPSSDPDAVEKGSEERISDTDNEFLQAINAQINDHQVGVNELQLLIGRLFAPKYNLRPGVDKYSPDGRIIRGEP